MGKKQQGQIVQYDILMKWKMATTAIMHARLVQCIKERVGVQMQNV